MNLTRITIPITDAERDALRLMAQNDLRDPRLLASLIIRKSYNGAFF